MQNFLVMNCGPGLGDVIQNIIYIFHLKNNHNCKIYFFSFQQSSHYNMLYKKIANNNEIFINLENFDNISSFDSIFLLFNSSTYEIFAGKNILVDTLSKIKYTHLHDIKVKDFIPSISQLMINNKNIFKQIHEYMKNIFCDSKDIFHVNNSITISIGTKTRCCKGITDLNFQNIISDLIVNNTNTHFCIIGKTNEIVSQKFKDCLLQKYPNVLNLIDKDSGLLDVINILYHSKSFITRSSGLLHLAGLVDVNIIHLKNYTRGFEYFFHNDVETYSIENDKLHPYYHEMWTPISLNHTRIVEYKKYDYFYNNFNYVYNYLFKIINSL